jgi:hypothetical protein
MIACMMDPSVSRLLLFATQSAERDQAVILGVMRNIVTSGGFPAPTLPALDTSLRMDKATGALLAMPLARSTFAVLSELATLNEVFSLTP